MSEDSDSDKNETTNMQKSKSLSNVGQFVSRKIWGSRSKCQNRQNHSQDFAPQRQKWTPLEKCSWISEEGQILHLTDTSLEKLSNIETEFLIHIALEKIKELNIGMNIDLDRNTPKTRVISKKRALTTSFFDIGRKDEHNGRDNLFGTSLECCLSRDKQQCGEVETGSKHSLASVFRSSRVGKLNDNVRSYESLPTKSMDYGRCSPSDQVASSTDYLTNLQKSSSMSIEMSRSQFDMRNVELDLDRILFTEPKNSLALNVPTFVTICIEYLEEYGLQKVGLFRVSTSQKRVKQLREDFDKNCNMRIPDNTCPHDVATLLKEFLRDLPEPLLCKRLYTTFLETQRIRNRRLQLEAISHLIKLLPVAHRDTLYVLLKFLGNVAAHCDNMCNPDGSIHTIGNKMDSNNLSTVFAPNILRYYPPKSAEYKEQGNMTDAINVIRIMIDHYEEIFKVPVDLLDLLYTHMLDTCPEQLHTLITTKINESSTTQVEISKSIENQVSPRDGTYNSALLPDGRRQSTPIILENQNVFSASLQISKPDEPTSKSKARANKMQESKVQTTTISEPKLPTSISNIGGATLCAKTAEFERNNTTKTSMPTAKVKPLYKRQQLISSSKR
ncbi:rho GTPase-activating protein 6 [Drosophila hydei]|uniref:Rho GTPase-activating protein 6 n=1 Tax=Drosophila hydei TaxID=7224 RepID=A0A6J1LY03_DROHY|nr:rho GTPase-activating protein 6 [Drosophila hydei]